MKSMPWIPGTPILLALLLFPIPLMAQEVVREPVSQNSLISGGPLSLLNGWFNAEYETKLSETFTVGGRGGWLDLDDTDYTGISAIVRYYHQGAALTGFYIGSRAGLYSVKRAEDSQVTLGLGMDVGYGWLLGPTDAFYIGLGIGGTGLFGLDQEEAKSFIPAIRLLDIGIAF
jgi:hypothetical protein